MSNITMPQLTTAPKSKARVSVAIDFERKKALEDYARGQNRSVHFVMLEMIDEKLRQAQEEAEYQKYIENRVMRAYNEMKENGSQGVSSSKAKEIVMQRVRANLENNK